MSVLNDKEIERYCKEYQLIKPYDKKKIKYASYDLRVGKEYILASEEKPRKLGENGVIEIPKYEVCYILTEEELNLQTDVCAFIFPRHGTVKKGILVYPQPPIDPGYKGKLYVLLHNLTTQKIRINQKDHLATIVFLKLSEKSAQPYGSDKENDKYMGAKSLGELGLSRVTGFMSYTSALKELDEKFEKFRIELLSRWLPIMLVVITIIMMILTIIIGFRVIN